MLPDREAYKASKACVDAAWSALQAANKPLRDRYEAASNAHEILMDEADLVGSCLSCGEPVFEGEEHQPQGEGEICCTDCAAHLSEFIASWRHEITQDPENGWSWNDTVDSKAEYMERLEAMEQDLAENGDRKILTT